MILTVVIGILGYLLSFSLLVFSLKYLYNLIKNKKSTKGAGSFLSVTTTTIEKPLDTMPLRPASVETSPKRGRKEWLN